MKKQSGFTLIELMIVVGIIGILAAVALPMYGDYMTKSRVVAAVSEADGVKTAIVLCAQENNGVLTSCSPALPATSGKVTDIDTSNGAITVEVPGSDGTTALGTVTLTPSALTVPGNVTWTITSDIKDCDKYLPKCSYKAAT